MVDAQLNVEQFNINGTVVDISAVFTLEQAVEFPRIAIVFEGDDCYRRLPMPITVEGNRVVATGSYDVAYVFYKKTPKTVRISFVYSDGVDLGKKYDAGLVVNNVRKNRLKHWLKLTKREHIKNIVGFSLNVLSLGFRLMPIKQNRISFFTARTSEPTGNLRAVYNRVKDMDDVDVHLCCHYGGALGTITQVFKFLRLYMTSRIVYVDDYYHLVSYVTKKKGTALVQLWHGCGAFKTFGYARFHKSSVLELYSANHRQYDYAIVSSPDVIDMYAESFGINNDKVLPLGSPRCDALVDEYYKNSFSAKFYDEHPNLKDKKLLLFAPTFRGGGNGDAYYPMDVFRIDEVLESLGDEWAVLTKLHPYCTQKFSYSPQYNDRVLDCFDYDVNDILIVTDFLVTDYSSVIFEASILNIPMAFLTFDLDEFVLGRDFYLDFKQFIPGPMAKDMDKLIDVIKQGGDPDAVERFKHQAYGDSLGTACDNMVEFTNTLLGR